MLVKKQALRSAFLWYPLPGQEAMGINTRSALWTSGNTSQQWEGKSSGTDCPEAVGSALEVTAWAGIGPNRPRGSCQSQSVCDSVSKHKHALSIYAYIYTLHIANPIYSAFYWIADHRLMFQKQNRLGHQWMKSSLPLHWKGLAE